MRISWVFPDQAPCHKELCIHRTLCHLAPDRLRREKGNGIIQWRYTSLWARFVTFTFAYSVDIYIHIHTYIYIVCSCIYNYITGTIYSTGFWFRHDWTHGRTNDILSYYIIYMSKYIVSRLIAPGLNWKLPSWKPSIYIMIPKQKKNQWSLGQPRRAA